MKFLYIHIFTLFFLHAFAQDNNKIKNLESELNRLNTPTVLIVPSMHVTDYAIWSPDLKYLGYSIRDKWYKVRLTDIKLAEGKWHNIQIGVLRSENTDTILTEEERKGYVKVAKIGRKEITTKDSIKIELKEMGDLSTGLIITEKGKESKIIWKSGGENCYALSLSPDEKYIAYVCELNGVFVMKLK